MNIEQRLRALRDLIQVDVGNRGLARDPTDNLLTACPNDFAAACRSIAETRHPVLEVVTGFWIANAHPPGSETDGPLGAVFLARALTPLGVRLTLWGDGSAVHAMQIGVEACGLSERVAVRQLPTDDQPFDLSPATHLIALERCGPGHTVASLRQDCRTTRAELSDFERLVPAAEQGRCRSMRGRDVTPFTRPAHRLFEERRPGLTTLGIGDGGNEIGMGKVRWDTIRRNIPNGGLIACGVATDYLIVAGVSNWGAYALTAGVALLRGQPLPADLFDIEREREILRVMVERGPLVDGVIGQPSVSVDGLRFDEYVKPLRELAKFCVV